MLAFRTQRHRPISVHLSVDEARELAIEAAIACSASDDVPDLIRLRDKLNALLDNPKRKRA